MIKIVIFFINIFLVFNSSLLSADSNVIEKVAIRLGGKDFINHISLEAVYGKTIFLSDDAVVFRIIKNQEPINSGIRSEVSINFPYRTGDEVIYSFEVFIPEDFEADKYNRWFIISQWHDQPNPYLKEDWSDFPHNSPPVSLFVKSKNGLFGLGVKYGNQYKWNKFEKGIWYRFDFQFLWSNLDNGKLSVNVDGHSFANFNGSNMLNDYQHYLKVGIYQHPDIKITNELRFRGLSIRKVKD